MHKSIQIITACENDSDVLFRWRNDPSTRAYSINTAVTEYADHIAWLKEKLKDPLSIIYIGYLEGEKIGVCRFDCDEQLSRAQISITLDPIFRGNHLSKPFLEASILEFQKMRAIPLIARVKVVNKVSNKCFTASGFNLIKVESGIAEYLHGKRAFNE